MIEAVTPGGVGEVGTENEGAVGGVRGSCVCVVVLLAGLAAAVDGSAGSNSAVGPLLN